MSLKRRYVLITNSGRREKIVVFHSILIRFRYSWCIAHSMHCTSYAPAMLLYAYLWTSYNQPSSSISFSRLTDTLFSLGRNVDHLRGSLLRLLNVLHKREGQNLLDRVVIRQEHDKSIDSYISISIAQSVSGVMRIYPFPNHP